MKVFSGTSGYSYKEWKGVFYPANIKAEEMLPFYAANLNAVEINNTFYRMPKEHVVDSWRDAVGPDFRFSIKASRRITHQKRLKDIEEPLSYLIKRAARLEDKLGVVLFQLPPNMRANVERLMAFLAQWPVELPAALEFRHDSWFEDECFEVLASRNIALVLSEDGESPVPAVTATGSTAYLRLRKPGYTDAALRKWVARMSTSGTKQLFAFFKHEDEGAGPELAKRFASLASRPAPKRAARRKTTRGQQAG